MTNSSMDRTFIPKKYGYKKYIIYIYTLKYMGINIYYYITQCVVQQRAARRLQKGVAH